MRCTMPAKLILSVFLAHVVADRRDKISWGPYNN